MLRGLLIVLMASGFQPRPVCTCAADERSIEPVAPEIAHPCHSPAKPTPAPKHHHHDHDCPMLNPPPAVNAILPATPDFPATPDAGLTAVVASPAAWAFFRKSIVASKDTSLPSRSAVRAPLRI
jgi:hypothetical protein